MAANPAPGSRALPGIRAGCPNRERPLSVGDEMEAGLSALHRELPAMSHRRRQQIAVGNLAGGTLTSSRNVTALHRGAR